MARKRATLEERMAKLQAEIEALVAGPSSSQARRMLAGKRAALHVMEKAKERGNTDYCKGPEPTPAERVAFAAQYRDEYIEPRRR